MRLGQGKPALRAAREAAALAQQGRDRPLLARSLLCEAEAQLRGAQPESAVATAQHAADLFDAAGDLVGLGRAHWVIAFAQTRLSRNEASRTAAQRAAALARQCGDDHGLANALNVLSFSSTDIAERMTLLATGGTGLRARGQRLWPDADRRQPLARVCRTGALAACLPTGRSVHGAGPAHGRTAEPGAGAWRDAQLEAHARRRGGRARAVAGVRRAGHLARRADTHTTIAKSGPVPWPWPRATPGPHRSVCAPSCAGSARRTPDSSSTC